jgi:hypothetical protein
MYKFKKSNRRKVLLGGIFTISLALFSLFFLWLSNRSDEPRQAPEAESILKAQLEMPFQVLIPAFLPKNFIREKVQVNVDKVGPQGEPMVLLIYPTRRGDYLTFYEWLPNEQSTQESNTYCKCVCMSRMDCNSAEIGMKVGSLRVMAKVSAPNILTSQEARSVLDTLGPATNRQIYSSLKEVPVTFSVSPAVDVPINADGVHELTLVVSPNGYSPEHFAVLKDVPVKLTFRQIGQVGCGNELIFQWGEGKSATIYLASPSDIQTLEFTPEETGEFRFNCPHLIYRGLMTVRE